MQLEADPRILTAVENAIAASRWRIAARFEGPETAVQFRRQSTIRSAAATAGLTSFAGTVGAQSADRPHSARNPAGGAG